MAGLSPARVPPRLSRRGRILVRGRGGPRPPDPSRVQRLHRVAAAGREPAPQEPRAGHRPLAESATDRVGRLDRPSAAIVVRREQAELVGSPRPCAPTPTRRIRRPRISGPRQLQRDVPDRLGKVGRLGERPLPGDGSERAVADLHLDRGRPHAARAQPGGHPLGEREERPFDLVDVAGVDVERVLVADGLRLDVAGDRRGVEPRARSASVAA